MKTTYKRSPWWGCAVCLSVALLGCGDDGPKGNTATQTSTTPTSTAAPAPFQVSKRPRLVWKKQTALAQDLGRALDLSTQELCNELGNEPCTKVHQASLGGNDPYEIGVYEPVADPLSTTPVVVDRFILAGCSQAVERDLEQPPRVFTTLNLNAESFDLSDDTQKAAIHETIRMLYRRFLSRDATDEEVAIVAELAQSDGEHPGLSGRNFAKAACFAVGSTTEFLFY